MPRPPCYTHTVMGWIILALVVGVLLALIGVIWWQIGRALMGAMGKRRAVPEGLPALVVDEIRHIDEATVLCGVHRIRSSAEPPPLTGRFGVFVDEHLADHIAEILAHHRDSDWYRPDTTRVLAIPLGAIADDCRVRVIEYGAEGTPTRSATIDMAMTFVEVAGSEADPAHRCDYDEQILMYPPKGVDLPRPPAAAQEASDRAQTSAAEPMGGDEGSETDGSGAPAPGRDSAATRP